MLPALPFDEQRQRLLLVSAFLFSPQRFPPCVGDVLASSTEQQLARFPRDGGSLELAVGVEHAYEAAADKVVHLPLLLCHSVRPHACGDDGVVVGHLLRVEHLLALHEGLALYPVHKGEVCPQPVEYLRALRVNVVGQEGGVNTWVGGELLLVEALNGLKREVCAEVEALVALHLKGGEVEQPWGCLAAVLLLHAGNGEGQPAYGGESLLRLLPRLEASLALLHNKGEECVTVERGEHPVGRGLEAVYLLLPPHYEGERRCLHPPYAEDVRAVSLVSLAVVAQRVEACGVDAQRPVAYGAAQPRLVEALVLALVPEVAEALSYSLRREAVYPEALDGTPRPRQLYHPPLYQLSLLPRVAAVDDVLGFLHKACYRLELPLYPLVPLKLYAEAGRYHRQLRERPALPEAVVLVGLLQLAEVAEGPRHLVAVALDVAALVLRSAQNVRYVPSHRRLLGYADYH